MDVQSLELAVDGYALVNHANAVGTSSALVFPDVALSPGWNLRAAVIVANVFDLGNEVSERHDPPFDRSTLEMQLPRSMNFSVELIDVPRASATR